MAIFFGRGQDHAQLWTTASGCPKRQIDHFTRVAILDKLMKTKFKNEYNIFWKSFKKQPG
jgi:hypothetical protein